MSQLPSDANTHSSANGNLAAAVNNMRVNNAISSSPAPVTSQIQTYNEKSDYSQQPPSYGSPSPMPPPPAPIAAPLTHAVALYAYAGTDAGDLSLQPNDRVAVTEYMNAEWWKGKSERTGQEGIFPRSYVRVEEKSVQPTSYGNMPLDVSNGAGAAAATPGQPNKFQEGGKKVGKKLGNAAIFGAGATIVSPWILRIFIIRSLKPILLTWSIGKQPRQQHLLIASLLYMSLIYFHLVCYSRAKPYRYILFLQRAFNT